MYILSLMEASENSPQRIHAEIESLKLEDEGKITQYVSYTIVTRIGENEKYVVHRRFNHFDWLHLQLQEKYPHIIIPPIPEKENLARFFEDYKQVLFFRKREFNRFLSRIIVNPFLKDDPLIKQFLTDQDALMETIKEVHQKANETFFSSLITSVTEVAKELNLKPQETIPVEDDWFQRHTLYQTDLSDYFSYNKVCAYGITQLLSQIVVNKGELALLLQQFPLSKLFDDQRFGTVCAMLAEITAETNALTNVLVKNENELFVDVCLDQQKTAAACRKVIEYAAVSKTKYRIAKKGLSEKFAGHAYEEKKKEEKEKHEAVIATIKDQAAENENRKSVITRNALIDLARENIEYEEQVLSMWKNLGKSLEKLEAAGDGQ